MWNEEDNPTKTGWIQFFIPYMSGSVVECKSIGSCSSNGLCAGLMITGLYFQLLLTLPPFDTECQWRVWKQFSRTCIIIQIKYVLPKLGHLPQYSYGSRDAVTTRVLGFASYLGLGTRDPYSYWGRGTVWQPILNLHNKKRDTEWPNFHVGIFNWVSKMKIFVLEIRFQWIVALKDLVKLPIS